ncbi:hypothetical protein BN903_38 [Halorubrum sp. AJ67]|nr:hypothetical protein BN903_38 [Halorubrum sp. AJ67]
MCDRSITLIHENKATPVGVFTGSRSRVNIRSRRRRISSHRARPTAALAG